MSLRTLSPRTARAASALVGLVAIGAVALAQTPATAAPRVWAPAASAKIHPGVQTVTSGAQCTTNFVFTDTANTNVYIGQAAHCSGTGAANETNGCIAGTLPVGTEVEVDGASARGTMVYNSWVAMQKAGETNEDLCYGNDFALIQLNPADAAVVNPSIPEWGGPVGLNTTGSPSGDGVYSYGNSGLRFGLEATSPKQGTSLGTDASGWSHLVYTVTPGIPGDSGSAFLDGSGKALGVLSTVALLPFPASNYVSDINRALAYMRSHSTLTGVQLALGTEPFRAGVF